MSPEQAEQAQRPLSGLQAHAAAIAAGAGGTTPGFREKAAESLSARLGKATWAYDRDLGVHIPCCSRWRWRAGNIVVCGNGPLSESEIGEGVCSEGPHIVPGSEPG